MSQFILHYQRPSPTVVSYGNDVERGFFCTVTRDGETVAEYNVTSPNYDGLEGLLQTLVSTGILTAAGVAEAFDLMPEVDHVCDIPSEAGQLAAIVIENLQDD